MNVTSPPETVTIARKPSHFGSNTQPSPVGSVVRGDGEHRLVAPAHVRTGVLAQEEPVLLVAVEARGNERPHAVETLAPQPYGQPPVPLLLEELVRALVPDLDRAGAVLPGRDDTFEVRVVERVVLDVHGEMPLAPAERNALGYGPARERTVSLEPEVVVEAPGRVALDHEAGSIRARGGHAERLGRLAPIALSAVLVEAHLWIVARNATVSLPMCCKMPFSPAQAAFMNRG